MCIQFFFVTQREVRKKVLIFSSSTILKLFFKHTKNDTMMILWCKGWQSSHPCLEKKPNTCLSSTIYFYEIRIFMSKKVNKFGHLSKRNNFGQDAITMSPFRRWRNIVYQYFQEKSPSKQLISQRKIRIFRLTSMMLNTQWLMKEFFECVHLEW